MTLLFTPKVCPTCGDIFSVERQYVSHINYCKVQYNYRITFESGFIIECVRKRKPTKLAESWKNEQGNYTIEKI